MATIVQLKYILDLSITESFSLSAQRCNVSQPTLSMQVKKVEEGLGILIFDRDKKGLKLTEFGKRFVDQGKNVLQEYEVLEGVINEEKELNIELQIGVIPTMSSFILPFINDYIQLNGRNVGITLHELTTENLVEKIELGELDAGFMAGSSKFQSLEQKTFSLEPLIPYVNSDEVSNVIEAIDLSDVTPWLLSSDNCLSLQTIKLCQLYKENAHQVTYHGGNMQLLVNMVNNQTGFTILPFFMMKDLELEDSYERIFKSISPCRDLVISYRKRNSKLLYISDIHKKAKEVFHLHSEKQHEIIDWNA